jgi:RecB family endonuclease NucS
MWEVTLDEKLIEIPSIQIALEKRLEDRLESDISMLDENLLVIGRQVRTDFGSEIDLLCLDNAGDTAVIELKRG